MSEQASPKRRIDLEQFKWPLVALVVVIVVVGAAIGLNDNIGNAPKGSVEEMQKQFDSMTPERQIENVKYWPIPPAEKEKKIQEIEKKYGITRSGSSPEAPKRG